jgi:hypothetical protein
MHNHEAVESLQTECQELFSKLALLQDEIRKTLAIHADKKVLKGNELVGWLGEIYGKLLFDGNLVHDRNEHDFITADGKLISVKTRKGWNSGWRQTSAIPKIEGELCPSHLLFVHLNDDYSLDRMWLFEWNKLMAEGRFKRHIVRGTQRSFIFAVDEKRDRSYIVYEKSR